MTASLAVMLIVSGTPTGTSAEHGGNGERLRLASAISKYELFGNFGKNRQTVTLQLTDAMTHNKLSLRAKLRLGRIGRTSRVKNRARRGRLVFESLEHRNLLAGDLLTSIEPDRFDYPLGQDQVLTTTSGGESSWATAEGESAAEGEDAPDLVAFAKALTDAGHKFYGSPSCSACVAQKERFGDGAEHLPFVDVTTASGQPIGERFGIQWLPTWVFADGSRVIGDVPLENLSERTGIPIPATGEPFEAPIIQPIADAELLAGSPLHVALVGYDPDGDPLTYTVTSDNPSVSATLVEQASRSMRIDVDGYGEMVFQLFEQRASRPTARVIELANSGDYDGVLFHRVIDGFMIQGGDPSGTGSGSSGLGTFDDQFHVDLQHNQAGVLSYAKGQFDDSNDSQFFVTNYYNPIYSLQLAGRPKGGSFTLSFGGQTTAPIQFRSNLAYSTLAANIQSALAALPNIGFGNVVVTHDPIRTTATNGIAVTELKNDNLKWKVEFVGELAHLTPSNIAFSANIAALTFDPLYHLDFTTNPAGGQFSLSFAGQTTSPILLSADSDFDAVAATIQAELAALSSIGEGNVVVTHDPIQNANGQVTVGPSQNNHFRWKVQFLGTLVDQTVAEYAESRTIDAAFSGKAETLRFKAGNLPEGGTPARLEAGHPRYLDFNHSVFGILVEGHPVLEAVSNTSTWGSNRPWPEPPGIRMNTVEIFPDTENAVMMLKAAPAAVGQQANITVTVTDGSGNQVQETFQVTVAADPVNGGPFLEDLPDFETTVDTPLQIQLSAIDVEGDPVHYGAQATGSVAAEKVEVDQSTRLVTVTPPDGYVGPLDILVGVRPLLGSDTGEQGSDTMDPWDTQVVRVNVVGGELELELLPDSDSNIVGDRVTNVTEMTFRISNTSAGGLVQILHDGTVIGQGTATGSSIDITTDNLVALGDGTYALTAVQTLNGVTGDPANVVTVTLDTTPPVPLTSTPPTTATNGLPLVYDAQHPEEGTPGFRYALVDAPNGAVIDAVTGVMRWTPTVNQGGVNTFQIVASDLAGNTQTQNLEIDVTVVAQQVRIELVVTDSQQNPITEISSGEEFLVLAYVQDIRTPAEGVFAAYVDVRYDQTLVSSLATAIGDITFGDTYQNGKSGFFTTPGLLDEVGAFANIFSPIGGDKYLLFAAPFRADQEGEMTFTPEPATDMGREVLVFGESTPVAENAITFVSATLTVDSGLSAQPQLFNVDEDSVNFSLDVLRNHINETGSPVAITDLGPTSHGGTVTIAAGGQRVLYTPVANFFGEETFWYEISAGGLTSTATVTVEVAPVNDPPKANDDLDFSVGLNSEDNFLDVLANDQFAPDQGEVLRIVGVGSTSHGGTVVIAPNGTHLLYTPASGFSGEETFTYTIRDRVTTDPTGLESTATVRINVESVPRPTAVNDTATVDEDSTDNLILVRANDSPAEPGATLTVVAVTQSKFGGTVTIAAGGTHVLYTPAEDFFGEDTFTYTIEEQEGGRATASVTVSVLNVNDPPTANDDSRQVSKGSTTRTLNVLENDSISPDVDEVLTIVAVTQGSEGGSVQIAADGKSVLYTPSSDPALPDNYTETFTYTVDDGSGADNSTDTATVTIQIRPYTERDLGGIVPYASTQYGVGGLMVRLSGMDQFNGSVSMNSQTVANGAYTFSDLAPGSYQIETDSAPFLVLPSTALNVDSADEDGDNLDLDFPAAKRDPSTIGIADFLARAPGQSSLSPADSVLVAIHPGNQQHWYSYQAGWQGYTQLEIELDADASLLSVQAVASNGQLYQGTVAMNNAAYVKRLANADESHLIRIDVGPEQLGLQPVHETPVVTVTPLITNSTTPMITGTVSDGTLQVTVADQIYAEDDGHLAVSGAAWSLQIPETDGLDEGTYNVTASATNEAGVVGSDGTTDELIIDTTAPTVTVNSLTTSNPTPAITGTVSDGSLSVTVNNQTYSPGDGNLVVVGTNWTLNIPAAHTLPAGTYNVSASSTDAAGNVGTDTTTGELVIEAEESGGEGEAIDLLWSEDRFLEDVQQTALQDLPTSDDAYAHAVDLILGSSQSG
jgi:cyclophilin family peptidyl-prolyl cis-trans isomerase